MKKFKQIQTITDPLLEPYFLTKDEYGFTVKEHVTPSTNHFKTQGQGKGYEKSLYYYPNFEQCLKKIAVLKLSEQANVDSIESYLESYLKISNDLKIYINETRSTI